MRRFIFLALFPIVLFSQNTATPSPYPNAKVSGLAYIDYTYTLDHSDVTKEGQHGFAFRRVFFTTDFNLSDKFSARARLESNGTTTNATGLAIPWLKDLSLTWKDAIAKGHNITFGIMPPPMYRAADEIWGYRSLEKTMLDYNRITLARDFGIEFNGKITADNKVKYAVMYSNNNAEKNENDLFKRIYTQLQWLPNKNAHLVVGWDYAGFANGIRGKTLDVIGSYKLGKHFFGVEAYQSNFSPNTLAQADQQGFSVFSHLELAKPYKAILRLDKVEWENVMRRTLFVGGVGYSPIPQIQLTPNVVLYQDDLQNGKQDRNMQARFTVYFRM